jgi:nanoRNase/pAp phosphatase (c-di-AMP/oligoRNAs hydrolase)
MGNAPSPYSSRSAGARPIQPSSLTAVHKLRRLLAVAKTKKRALVLTHDNPDPDAVASAVGLAWLLRECAGIKAQAAYGGIIGRAENKAMLKVLNLDLEPVAKLRGTHDLLCLVDTQPEVGNYSAPTLGIDDDVAKVAIDHHPARPASALCAFQDVGGPTGATSTLICQYLRAAGLVPSAQLATALFYGIKSDTRDLGREVDPADLESYAWLFPYYDKTALSQIEHPTVPAPYFAAYHLAYERARLHGGGRAVVVDMGQVYVPEIVPEVAEKLVSLEGLRWSVATGAFLDELYLSLRLNDKRFNAGKLVRQVCAPFGGSAGGHGAMAGARIPLRGRDAGALAQQLFAEFLLGFHVEPGPGIPLVP